jgi:hypothetical protein
MRFIFCGNQFRRKLISPLWAPFKLGIVLDKCEKKLNSVQQLWRTLLVPVSVVRAVCDSNYQARWQKSNLSGISEFTASGDLSRAWSHYHTARDNHLLKTWKFYNISQVGNAYFTVDSLEKNVDHNVTASTTSTNL